MSGGGSRLPVARAAIHPCSRGRDEATNSDAPVEARPAPPPTSTSCSCTQTAPVSARRLRELSRASGCAAVSPASPDVGRRPAHRRRAARGRGARAGLPRLPVRRRLRSKAVAATRRRSISSGPCAIFERDVDDRRWRRQSVAPPAPRIGRPPKSTTVHPLAARREPWGQHPCGPPSFRCGSTVAYGEGRGSAWGSHPSRPVSQPRPRRFAEAPHPSHR